MERRAADSARSFETFGRIITRAIPVLKARVAEFDGDLVDSKTGVVLSPAEAYETVYASVKEEPLGTTSRICNLATLL